jgi:hypothetical protein
VAAGGTGATAAKNCSMKMEVGAPREEERQQLSQGETRRDCDTASWTEWGDKKEKKRKPKISSDDGWQGIGTACAQDASSR